MYNDDTIIHQETSSFPAKPELIRNYWIYKKA